MLKFEILSVEQHNVIIVVDGIDVVVVILVEVVVLPVDDVVVEVLYVYQIIQIDDQSTTLFHDHF